jgi:hypothetical protein
LAQVTRDSRQDFVDVQRAAELQTRFHEALKLGLAGLWRPDMRGSLHGPSAASVLVGFGRPTQLV